MNKKLLAVALSAALALPLVALAQADMSGTWTFDEAKSDPAPQGGGGAGRGGGGGGGGRMGGGTPSKLVIKQGGGTLTVESTLPNGAQTAVYKLDGSENVNKMAMGESKSTAKWEGSTLVISGTQALSTPQGEFQIATKEVYSLSGNVLTITTTRTTPRGDTTRKLVFNKG